MGDLVALRPTAVNAKPAQRSGRIRFTEDRVAALPTPAAGSSYAYDTEQPGLAVRVTTAGVRTFVLIKKVDGKPQRITLGRFPGLRLGAARQAARQWIGKIAAGVDVVQEIKAQRARKRTLADEWSHYLERIRLSKGNRTWERDKKRWETAIAPKIGHKALSELALADLQRVVTGIGVKHPIAANRVAALLGSFVRFATAKHGLPNPAHGLERFPESVRERFLRADEVGKLLEAIRAAGDPWADLFELLLWTGARRGAVMTMAWDDIDLRQGVWHLQAAKTKNKRAATLPLTEPALAILRRREERRAGEAWVFPGDGRTGHVATVAKAWARVLTAAGLSDLRPHDLRRTVGSWLAGGGHSAFVIQRALTHASSASAKHYAHLDVTAVRAALDQVAEAMQRAVEAE